MNRPTTDRARSRRAGFTLIEMMVALAAGGLVIAAVFTLGGASARHFQEQQRVGVTQRSVRMAMERLRRDIARAGYMHVPSTNSPFVRTCPVPVAPGNLPAVAFTDDDPTGNGALLNRGVNRVSADRLRLTGNYVTDDAYLVRTVNANGSAVFLQTDWLAFQRAFTSDDGTGSRRVDTARFQEVFAAGRMLHIETRTGTHFFVTITSATLNGLGNMAQVNINPALGVDNPCLEGLGRGALVSPVTTVEYGIVPAAGVLVPNNQNVTGANTVLQRQELDPATLAPIPGTQRAVLEWAVDFNLDFVLDTNPTPGNPPNLVQRTGTVAAPTVAGQPWQVRSIIASLAARTPEQDRRFPWPTSWGAARPVGQPLNRFRVFTDRQGAARVRQLTTEVQMPNLVPRR
ncbi:MAG: prepilin-type N-terminal cleavage/methylation domain-containing protein [Sandaracinaceae bacterium]